MQVYEELNSYLKQRSTIKSKLTINHSDVNCFAGVWRRDDIDSTPVEAWVRGSQVSDGDVKQSVLLVVDPEPASLSSGTAGVDQNVFFLALVFTEE